MKPEILYNIYDRLNFWENDLLRRNKVLQNRYKNKRCFLILSGESLNHINIELLKNEYTFGSNFLFLHPKIEEIDLDFFLCVEAGKQMDKIGHPGSSNWPENIIKSNGEYQGYLFLKESFKRINNEKTKIFLNHDKLSYYKKIKLFNVRKKNLFYLRYIPNYNGNNVPRSDLEKRFSCSIDGGALSRSIFLIINMGFKEIYLCGTGYTYDPPYLFHFYDNYVFPKSEGKLEAVKNAKNKIKEHNKKYKGNLRFSGLIEKGDSYRLICTKQVDKKKWEPYIDQKIINNYAKSKDVNIFNVVPKNFESPYFKKVNWNEIVKNFL